MKCPSSIPPPEEKPDEAKQSISIERPFPLDAHYNSKVVRDDALAVRTSDGGILIVDPCVIVGTKTYGL